MEKREGENISEPPTNLFASLKWKTIIEQVTIMDEKNDCNYRYQLRLEHLFFEIGKHTNI